MFFAVFQKNRGSCFLENAALIFAGGLGLIKGLIRPLEGSFQAVAAVDGAGANGNSGPCGLLAGNFGSAGKKAAHQILRVLLRAQPAAEQYKFIAAHAADQILRTHGAGEKAAKFAGIRADRVKFLVYVLAGAITGFAAFISAIKIGSVTSNGGNQLETQILIALVLGGMPISGGAMARFYNVIVGSLLYVVLTSGLTMMGFSTQMMQLIQGVVFLAFVAIFADRQSLTVIK